MGGNEVRIATTTHPFAITMYGFLIALGLGHTIGWIGDEGVLLMLGQGGFSLWQTAHLIAPILMAVGAFAARREAVPIFSLLTEMVGCFTFAVTKSIVVWAIHAEYGFGGGQMSQLLMTGVIAACVARGVVITREIRAIRNEAERPSQGATPPQGG